MPVTLVPSGALWKFHDRGADLGTSWMESNFDDGAWVEGSAELGYGDGDEETVLSFGPDPNDKPITTYFRKSFAVTDSSSFIALTISVLRDDGAVVYLNGTEVFRSNLPEGAIAHETLASSNVTRGAEIAFYSTNLPPGLLAEGRNVLAVEIHQFRANSADLSFDLDLTGELVIPEVTRGPYLQQGTKTNVTVRWRTDVPTDSAVRWGTSPQDLSRTAMDTAATTEHVVPLAGLLPDTRYYYAIGTTAGTLAGDDSYSFVTAPSGKKPTRVWVLGDSGTANVNARAVRDAYDAFNGERYTDVWLMLGDNAYFIGTDLEYQAAVFDMYPERLRQTPLWPTIGNHDTAFSYDPPPDLPYFNIFSLPTGGEAGGVPSGTEKYYSFDYGNIHFVCLDSMASDRSSNGVMCSWLRADLEANTNEWLIAYWHHPPYTKGSHDSDFEFELVLMRENVVPILEAYGVDLVLSGHSHSYERSFLLDGHYGPSITLVEGMLISDSNGREDGDGPYVKPDTGPNANQGAVYVVAGSSGQSSGGPLNHPAMFISLNELGSLVLDIENQVLQGKFVRADGAVPDYFTIIKGREPSAFRLAYRVEEGKLTLTWNTIPQRSYAVERCRSLEAPDWTAVSAWMLATGVKLSWSAPLEEDPLGVAYYRVKSAVSPAP